MPYARINVCAGCGNLEFTRYILKMKTMSTKDMKFIKENTHG
jgi:hypothetical protein